MHKGIINLRSRWNWDERVCNHRIRGVFPAYPSSVRASKYNRPQDRGIISKVVVNSIPPFVADPEFSFLTRITSDGVYKHYLKFSKNVREKSTLSAPAPSHPFHRACYPRLCPNDLSRGPPTPILYPELIQSCAVDSLAIYLVINIKKCVPVNILRRKLIGSPTNLLPEGIANTRAALITFGNCSCATSSSADRCYPEQSRRAAPTFQFT